MHIVKTELINVGPHVSLAVEFGPGLIGIYGRNGTGKSCLMNVGGYANLTNDYQARTGKVRAGLIRRGAEDTDPSYCETQWEHNGTSFSIRRDLRKESHRLQVGKNRPITGAREIQGWLEQTLRVCRQTLDNHIFVGQGLLTDFITQTPTDRAETFSHLCGTTGLGKIYDALGERITKDLPLSAMPNDNSDELLARIGAEKKTVRTTKAELKQLQPKLLKLAARKELRELVSKRQAYLRFRKEHTAAVEALQAATDVAGREDTASQAAVKALNVSLTEVEKLTPAADEAARQLDDYENAERLARSIANFQNRLDAAVAPVPPEKPEVKWSLKKIQDSLSELRSELAAARKLTKLFDETGNVACPTCGTAAEELETHLADARETCSKWPAKIRQREAEERALLAYTHATEAYVLAEKNYKRDVANWEAAIKDLSRGRTDVSPPDQVSLQAVLDARLAAEAKVDANRIACSTIQRRLAGAQATCKEREARVCELVVSLDTNKVSKIAADDAKQLLAIHDAAAPQVAVLQERLQNALDAIVEASADLETLKAAKRRTGLVRSWLASLETLREDVFHRTKLPQMLHEDAMEELVDTMNETLAEAFGDPFSVKVGDRLAFIAVKSDGEEEARALSGGQKVVLAIAFRLAINSIFAGELGMMVLDEPTDGLDEENVDCLHDALTSLSAFARRQGSQIVVITHDTRLETAFDRVIRL